MDGMDQNSGMPGYRFFAFFAGVMGILSLLIGLYTYVARQQINWSVIGTGLTALVFCFINLRRKRA